MKIFAAALLICVPGLAWADEGEGRKKEMAPEQPQAALMAPAANKEAKEPESAAMRAMLRARRISPVTEDAVFSVKTSASVAAVRGKSETVKKLTRRECREQN